MSDLLPCPFCGGDDIEYQFGTTDREGTPTACMCGDCGSVGPWEYCSREFERYSPIAIKAWNQRAQGWVSVEESKRIKELSMIVRRLCYSLKSVNPHSSLIKQSMEYLEKHGIAGEPLRVNLSNPPKE